MIPAETLVPGDVVFLESGDKIPADIRLTDVKNLRTEEAALTGESVPADKIDRSRLGQGDGRRSFGHGLFWHDGGFRPRDRNCGRDRQRRPNSAASTNCSPTSARSKRRSCSQIKKFGYAITAIILIVSAITFAFGHLVRDIPFVEMFQAVTGIAVSMIPEGLPALITITLAIGVQRMARPQRHHPPPAGGRDAGLRRRASARTRPAR